MALSIGDGSFNSPYRRKGGGVMSLLYAFVKYLGEWLTVFRSQLLSAATEVHSGTRRCEATKIESTMQCNAKDEDITHDRSNVTFVYCITQKFYFCAIRYSFRKDSVIVHINVPYKTYQYLLIYSANL